MTRSLRLAVLFAAVLSMFACGQVADERAETEAVSAREPANSPPVLPGELVAENERGVGLMGQYEYSQAVEIFGALGERHPDLVALKVNQAIAFLNRQQEGDEALSLALCLEALEFDPESLPAHYTAGLLYLRSGDGRALEHLEEVIARDSSDVYASYHYALALEREGRDEEALAWYERSVEQDPYFASGYYRTARLLLRLKRRPEGREMMGRFQELGKNSLAAKAEYVYGKMGPKATAISLETERIAPPPQGAPFDEARPLFTSGAADLAFPAEERALGATAADLDGDGIDDLVLLPRPGGGAVGVRAPDGSFRLDPAHPLAQVPGVRTALWGDFDDDGLLDVYLCRTGENLLLRQMAGGAWEDVTEATGTANGSFDTVDGAFVDADHDGDLDLFCVNANGADELLNNDGNGSFRPLAAETGLAGGDKASRQIVVADLDRDRDADLIVLRDQPPHVVFRNGLGGIYDEAPGFEQFTSAAAAAAVAGDFDADGHLDLITRTPEGSLVWWGRGADGAWTIQATAEAAAGDGGGTQRLLVFDVDGDGRLELLTATGHGWEALGFAAEGIERRDLAPGAPLLDAIPLLLDPAAGPSLLEIPVDGAPTVRGPGPGRHRFATLSFTGQKDAAASMRSNASGIGTAFIARSAGRASIGSTYRAGSGPGQSFQAVAVGLGGAPRVDHLAITWSDGLYQSELALEPGKHHRIPETQREVSSCPVLFAWDGESYAFVTDLLGGGAIGYLIAPGEYAPVRPRECLTLPESALQPLEGRYVVKLTEPMEEICYLDQVILTAWDLPPGWNLVLDERMAILGPEPTGEPRFYRRELTPQLAVNDRGELVTEQVVTRDGIAAVGGRHDRRFLGMLEGRHVLTLTFDRALDEGPGDPVLVAGGWIEYPYSQTTFAAAQAGRAYEAPTLEARGTDGEWRVLAEQFGYPAGMPKSMSLPLEGLPAGCTALRLSTNQAIGWDRIAVVWTEPCPDARSADRALAAAELRRCGFARHARSEYNASRYDYADSPPLADTRHLRGYYTDFGDVAELVADTDDALAIFGPGEEVHLEFTASSEPAPDGWTRCFVLDTRGWCKDMDLYTGTGAFVEPVPSRAPQSLRTRELHARYNLRWESGT